MNKPCSSTMVLERRDLQPASSRSRGSAPRQVLIVGDRPVFARAIQSLVNTSPWVCSSQIVRGADLPRLSGIFDPDAVLLIPQDWPEFAAWLPCLRRRLASCPWVLLADWRLVGMFLSFLTDQPCVLVEPSASDLDLGHTLEAVAAAHFSCPTAELIAHFAHRVSLQPTHLRTRLPTAMELQCGCAVSFGLRDGQIAQLLQLGEATVKSHVHHLLRKLALRNRVELGELVRRAFASPTPPF